MLALICISVLLLKKTINYNKLIYETLLNFKSEQLKNLTFKKLYIKQILVVFTFLFSCNCFQQFSAGVKAGGILSNFRFENIKNEKNTFKPSFYIGGFAEYKSA